MRPTPAAVKISATCFQSSRSESKPIGNGNWDERGRAAGPQKYNHVKKPQIISYLAVSSFFF